MFNKIRFYFIVSLSLIPIAANAQVVPDVTLGAESSTIRSIDQLRDAIEGGAIRGDNLFHSFSEFSIKEGRSVDFANPEGITNIFSRVTGSNISEIFGTLMVDGAANLFLINSNGIVFGENAAIDVRGSFIATTAETIEFNSGDRFSTINPDSPRLTIDFPIGLGLGSNSGLIAVNGAGNNLVFPDTPDISSTFFSPVISSEDNSGLKIFSEQTLAFIGNGVELNGGLVANPSGSIIIDSIEEGTVGIDRSSIGFTFDYSQVSKFGNIILDNSSILDTSGVPGGNIDLRGNNLLLQENSILLNSNFGDEDSGTINIDLSGSLEVVGVTSTSSILNQTQMRPGIISQAFGRGKGSDINISAENMNLSDLGLVTTSTSGSSNGGDINITVSDSLTVIGQSFIFQSPTGSSITTSSIFGSGRSGNITLSGKKLIVDEGGLILSQALQGDSGNVSINFSDSVELSNSLPLNTSPESFFTGSIIGTTTNLGDGGDVVINTAKLSLDGGARINATTTSSGTAGDISIRAVDMIEVKGNIPNSDGDIFSNLSQITAASEVTNLSILIELFGLPDIPTGQSGNIKIDTGRLLVNDEGVIAVLNEGTGNAGNLEINADSISLENGGKISGSTVSGEGGNITLNTDNLELLNQSQITASAGGEGNGGNINIDSETILGLNNSDITANAVAGDGGNIGINADFIFGLEGRAQLTAESDITATSEFGVNGTVEINSPDSNADEDLIIAARKVDITNVRDFLEQGCHSGSRRSGSELVYLGGGLRHNPNNFFDDTAIENTSTPIKTLVPQSRSNDIPPLWSPGDPIVEPNAVQINPDGRKFLIAVEEVQRSESQVCTTNAQDLK